MNRILVANTYNTSYEMFIHNPWKNNISEEKNINNLINKKILQIKFKKSIKYLLVAFPKLLNYENPLIVRFLYQEARFYLPILVLPVSIPLIRKEFHYLDQPTEKKRKIPKYLCIVCSTYIGSTCISIHMAQ